jgi:hypothetical protein
MTVKQGVTAYIALTKLAEKAGRSEMAAIWDAIRALPQQSIQIGRAIRLQARRERMSAE